MARTFQVQVVRSPAPPAARGRSSAGGRVTAKLEFGRWNIRQPLTAFAQTFDSMVGAVALLMLPLSFAEGGPFRMTFVDTATETIEAGTAQAALLAPLA